MGRSRQYRAGSTTGKAGCRYPLPQNFSVPVLQAQSQFKALYKDHAETIMGNMDSVIFLGGREHSTIKEL
jgi:hypothetical protein